MSSCFKSVFFFFCYRAPLLIGALLAPSAALEASGPLVDSRPTITFVCEPRPDQPNYRDALIFLTSVFDQLGYRYIQKHAHTSEAIRRLKAGEVDGDCGRLNGFIETSGLNGYEAIGPAYSHASFSRWYLQPPLISREHQRVGYNSNAIMLKKHLLKMGYKRLFPIIEQRDLTKLLLNGELDVVVNYERAMSFIDSSDKHQKIKSSDSFMTLPVRPYIHKSLAVKFEKRWLLAAEQTFIQHRDSTGPAEIPEKDRTKIVFSCSLHADAKLFRYFESTYTQLFRTLGYEFQLISMPRARETHELSKGTIDGSCGRTIFHESHQPNTIRVKEPIVETDIRVWSRIPYGEINSFDDIPASTSLAIVRGTTYLDRKLKGYAGNVVQTPSMTTGVKMLAAGRVDYLLGFEIAFQSLVSDTIIDSPIYGVGTLDSLQIYPYLHQSQIKLAEKLERLLQLRGLP